MCEPELVTLYIFCDSPQQTKLLVVVAFSCLVHVLIKWYEKEFYAPVRSYFRWRLSVVLHQTMHLPKAHW